MKDLPAIVNVIRTLNTRLSGNVAGSQHIDGTSEYQVATGPRTGHEESQAELTKSRRLRIKTSSRMAKLPLSGING